MAETAQTYQSKPSGCPGAVALALGGSDMAPRTTTRSFRNDHVIGWPMGTGDDPPG